MYQIAIFLTIQVAQFLEKIGLGKYKETFIEEEIDGTLLLELDESVLKEDLGMSARLHRIKLMSIIDGRVSVSKFNKD